jgi:hypothetical protein
VSEPIKIPQSIHFSLEGHDPGEMIFLFTGADETGSIVGEVYNFDDFPCLDEDQLGEVDAIAISTARKIVLAYNAYDEMLEALDPDALEAIADEINSFEHSARADSLRVIACKQRAAGAKAKGESA